MCARRIYRTSSPERPTVRPENGLTAGCSPRRRWRRPDARSDPGAGPRVCTPSSSGVATRANRCATRSNAFTTAARRYPGGCWSAKPAGCWPPPPRRSPHRPRARGTLTAPTRPTTLRDCPAPARSDRLPHCRPGRSTSGFTITAVGWHSSAGCGGASPRRCPMIRWCMPARRCSSPISTASTRCWLSMALR